MGFAILLLIMGWFAIPDSLSWSATLKPVELNGKCGFVDKDGREVIPLKYYYAESFSEGLAMVKLNNQGFYVDKEGYCVYGNAPAGHPKR